MNTLQTSRLGISSLSLSSLLNPSTKVWVNMAEHLVRLLTHARMSVTQMTRDVLDKVILLTGLAAKDLPETIGLDVVLLSNRELLCNDSTSPLLVFLGGLDGLILQGTKSGGVVRVGAVVALDVHVAVTVPGAEGLERAVNGDLLVVTAETVAVGIRVGEETGLEDGVGGRLDTGDHVGRREGGLLDFCEVVLRVTIEGELSEAAEGHFGLRPDLGEVEDVPAELLGLFGGEHLDVASPGGVLAALDGVEEVLGVPIGVSGGEVAGFFVGESLVALVCLAVNLNIVEGAVGLGPFVGMA